MERRQLGGTDVEVSRIILGCGNFGGIGSAPEFFGQGETEDEAFRSWTAPGSSASRHSTRRDAYGGGRSETIDRQVDRRAAASSPGLATKTFNPMDAGARPRARARAHDTRQLESSLERLGVDRGRRLPGARFRSGRAGRTSSWGRSKGLIGISLIRAWGVSNFDARAASSSLQMTGTPPSCRTRTRCSTARDEGGVVELCAPNVRDRVHAVQPARRRLADREVQSVTRRRPRLADGDAPRPVRASA